MYVPFFSMVDAAMKANRVATQWYRYPKAGIYVATIMLRDDNNKKNRNLCM